MDTPPPQSAKPSTPPPAPQTPALNKWGLEEGYTPENWLVGLRDHLRDPLMAPGVLASRSLPSPRPSPLTARDWSALSEGCTPWDWLVPGPSSAAQRAAELKDRGIVRMVCNPHGQRESSWESKKDRPSSICSRSRFWLGGENYLQTRVISIAARALQDPAPLQPAMDKKDKPLSFIIFPVLTLPKEQLADSLCIHCSVHTLPDLAWAFPVQPSLLDPRTCGRGRSVILYPRTQGRGCSVI